MKNRCSRVIALFLLLALLAGLVPGYAAEKPSIRGTRVLWVGVGKCAVLLDNLPEDAAGFRISSSKKDVIKVGKDSDDAFGMWMKPVKTGKSTVTITYKSGGKTRKISAQYKAKKYPDPFAWIKVDGKKLNLKKDKVAADVTGYKKNSVKVNFQLNSGWKLNSLSGMRFGQDGNTPFTWKKNKAVSFSNAGTLVFSIQLKNTKSGDLFEYLLMIDR